MTTFIARSPCKGGPARVCGLSALGLGRVAAGPDPRSEDVATLLRPASSWLAAIEWIGPCREEPVYFPRFAALGCAPHLLPRSRPRASRQPSATWAPRREPGRGCWAPCPAGAATGESGLRRWRGRRRRACGLTLGRRLRAKEVLDEHQAHQKAGQKSPLPRLAPRRPRPLRPRLLRR